MEKKVELNLAKPNVEALVKLWERLAGQKATPEQVKEIEASLLGNPR